MAKRTKYRSVRNARRFRVLVTGAMPAAGYHVVEGLAKPRRGAFWQHVATVSTGAEATKLAQVLAPEHGFAILAPDGHELDFVSPAGEVTASVPLTPDMPGPDGQNHE